MGQYNVYAKLEKNRLYIQLSGFLTEEESEAAADKVLDEAKKLQKGFTLVNDITGFKPSSQAGAENIKRAQAGVMQLGVSHVVRIVKNKSGVDISNMQFQRKSKEVDGYKADIAESIEEADQILDKA